MLFCLKHLFCFLFQIQTRIMIHQWVRCPHGLCCHRLIVQEIHHHQWCSRNPRDKCVLCFQTYHMILCLQVIWFFSWQQIYSVIYDQMRWFHVRNSCKKKMGRNLLEFFFVKLHEFWINYCNYSCKEIWYYNYEFALRNYPFICKMCKIFMERTNVSYW